jgi:hypothetical protein
MILIFATSNLADALIEKGYQLEAKRLLSEAALLEPAAVYCWSGSTNCETQQLTTHRQK